MLIRRADLGKSDVFTESQTSIDHLSGYPNEEELIDG